MLFVNNLDFSVPAGMIPSFWFSVYMLFAHAHYYFVLFGLLSEVALTKIMQEQCCVLHWHRCGCTPLLDEASIYTVSPTVSNMLV